MRTLQYLKKKFFFLLTKFEKITFKSCSEKLKPTFFLTALNCPNGPDRRIHVPKCGQLFIKLGLWCLKLSGSFLSRYYNLNSLGLKSSCVFFFNFRSTSGKSSTSSKIKKAVAIGAVAYGSYKVGQLTSRFDNFRWGHSYRPTYGKNFIF